ncbi:CAAX amino terminal protease family protein [Plesiocystis pacifica SIR-1]|uniref:CAAX amino terminal protease family protein n=1 Tax=Plesiocystis pacifica SIR-1 TaxID=391625 RepID=A6GBU1_9BACT|nr:CPBP family intramembrane glutamic endopeptidase [Plesiocystis pacifica]EDM76614.1 CAAX amino terminal protease family protein [Plesiocystis pacifica SIR-1]
MARERSHEDEEPRRRSRGARPATQGSLRNHLAGRVDPLTSAILIFPLFIIYQLGILLSRGLNGVDFVTASLVELADRDLANYLVVLSGMLLAYAAILVLLRRTESFDPKAFVPVLAESTFYALTMGSIILFVMHRFTELVPGLSAGGELSAALASGLDFLDVIVISAGAGLHEELIFRLIGVGGLSWLLAGMVNRGQALVIAVVVSSLVFSLAHHIGPSGEAFTFAAFVYRTLAGVFFALIYQVRGLAVAVWTHAIYDIYVLGVLG